MNFVQQDPDFIFFLKKKKQKHDKEFKCKTIINILKNHNVYLSDTFLL